MTKTFKRTVENFVCENCDCKVIGNGYTNHCPQCLYSKHVDVNPGDRAAECKGLMQPKVYTVSTRETTLLHTCSKCGFSKVNKASSNDKLQNIASE